MNKGSIRSTTPTRNKSKTDRIQDLEQKMIEDLETSIVRSRFMYQKYKSRGSFNDSQAQFIHKPKEFTHDPSADHHPNVSNLKDLPSYKPTMKIPIYVPQSIIRRAKKLPPPTVQRVLQSGEVVTVHILTESIPTFDPLIKVDADVNSLGKKPRISHKRTDGKIIDQINKSYHHKNTKSVPPKHTEKEMFQLTKPTGILKSREVTPRIKATNHIFREISYDESTHDPDRP